MDWIKRNLIFVIGASVALILMIAAGIYTWSGWSNNAKAQEEITAKYEELKRLINLNPNPGSGKVNNIETAKQQNQAVAEIMGKVATRFEAIPAIPPETNVTAEAFSSGLSTTIHRLQQAATNAGVILPPRYNFSFEKQSTAVKFTGNLPDLAVQLGEVSAIANVLIGAKVNALDSIQRARVTPDDQAGPATDYIDQHSETNELAILSPYQITFRSFTPELAQVLCGFAGSADGIIVKSVNVETAAATYGTETALAASPVYTQYNPINPAIPPGANRRGEDAFRERYGIGARGPTPAPQQPVYAQPTTPVATAPKTVLDEKQLKITMLVQVVKLLPKK